MTATELAATKPERASTYYAVEESDLTGAIVLWRLSGDADADTVRSALLGAGIEEGALPRTATPRERLRRAIMDHQQRTRFPRCLPTQAGWVLVEERHQDVAGKAVPRYHETLRVGVIEGDADGKPLPAALAIETEDAKLAESVKAKWAYYETRICTDDLSGWLPALVVRLGGTPLRDAGGVYFIPRDGLRAFKSVAKALHATTGHMVVEVPALRTNEAAVRAILDAIGDEAAQAAAKMESVLADGELGARALKSKAAEMATVRAKVERYETLLGGKLTAITERLDSLRIALTSAALAAEGEEN